jgi:hypothetical protein
MLITKLIKTLTFIHENNWNIENCLKYNFIKLSFNWHVKSSAIYTPNATDVVKKEQFIITRRKTWWVWGVLCLNWGAVAPELRSSCSHLFSQFYCWLYILNFTIYCGGGYWKYNFIKLSFNWHVKSSAIYTPNAYEVICRVARMAE